MTVVSMNYLLEAGVHFGHQKRRWNPKMKEYIYTTRDDIYIIDLQKTARAIEKAYAALQEIAENGGKVLFVGTKKQAQEAAEENATRTNMYFINERWLGGTLTNFKTIKSRIRRMEEIEKMETDGTFDLLPKKEVAGLKKEYEKLNKNLRGIRDMKKVPDALIIVDPRKEEIAIKEARILGIPVFGIVDTNCDPDMVDYVIPGNDDAVRAVKLVIGALTNAIAVANGNEVIDYTTEEDKAKDAKRKEEADVKNELEQLVFATEKAIKDLGDKITDKEKSEAEDAVKVAKEAMDSNDLDKMKDAKEKLNEKAMALGSKVYEEAAKANQANAGATSESTDNDKKDDSVVDADYEEK